MTATYYDGDLSPDESLITLETADTILATTLRGRAWTERVDADRRACFDDLERQPQRNDDKSALRDATAMLAAQPWKGRLSNPDQLSPFPRTGLVTEAGKVIIGIPVAVQQAVAILAAHLREKADQPLSPEVMQSYQIGESAGVFRKPSLDALSRPVRQLINPFVNAGASWSPVRA